jgi:hypothetical protein
VKRALDKMQPVGNSAIAKKIRILAPYMGKYKGNPPA